MKEIRAYIQPFMLHAVTQELLAIPHFPGMSLSDCSGFGRGKGNIDHDFLPFFETKRIEVFAPEELVEQIFTTIMKYANTHQEGSGKVFVLDVIEGGLIKSGERGSQVL
ncbi:MAG: P-II family nitrogen regulator [Methylococcaceae bacterium]